MRHMGGGQPVDLFLEQRDRAVLAAGDREAELADEGRHAVADRDHVAAAPERLGADMQHHQPRLGPVGQAGLHHLAAFGILQAPRGHDQAVLP